MTTKPNKAMRRLNRAAELKAMQLCSLGVLRIRSDGTIWKVGKRVGKSIKVKKRKKPILATASGQYLTLQIPLWGKNRTVQAHRVVYRWFHGKIPKGYYINHKDGNKHNNHPSNLEAVTPSENTLHAIHVLGKMRQKQSAC